jgi:chemotaxis protein methyltransferase CheR
VKRCRTDPQPLRPPSAALSRGCFRELAALVGAASGVSLADEKLELLASRLRPLLGELGLERFEELVERARTDDEVVALMVDRATTSITGFFRHPAQFDTLRAWLRARAPGGAIRVWSIGAATGEEPYSIAMLLAEHQLDRDPRAEAKVLATDLSRRALDRARDATYSREDVAAVPNGVGRFLEPTGDGRFRPVERVRRLVHLRRHDLRKTGDAARARFDVVFCRNVLIYFHVAQRQDVVTRLMRAVKPGGLFFLGPSETAIQLGSGFARHGPACYRRDA